MRAVRSKLTYANVMVTILAFVVLGGASAFAATQLAKNSVGTKQLKKNAVTSAKVKKHTLTGKNINLAKLGTVPAATNASIASSLTPPEATRLVGTSGQPPFLDGSANVPSEAPIKFQPVGFYKDHDGIVHLEGVAAVGTKEEPLPGIVFALPPGYRPASGTIVPFEPAEKTTVLVIGSNFVVEGKNLEGDVLVEGEKSTAAILGGLTFRAES